MTETNHTIDFPNCPFGTASELRSACRRRQAFVDVQYGQATSWAMSRSDAIALLVAFGVGAWLWLPVVVVVYAAIARSWFMLLGIPIGLIFYNLGYPLAHVFVCAFRLLAFASAGAVLAAAIVRDHAILAALACTAIVAGIANFGATHVAVAVYRREVLANEDLLLNLWGHNQLRIRLATGETYTVAAWRNPAGQFHANPRPKDI